MSRSKSLLLGFLIGGTVGATTMLLNAPSSGKELRERVKKQGKEWQEMANQLVQNSIRLKEQITETSKEGVVLIQNLTNEMKHSVQEWKESVEPHRKNIHKYLEQIEASLKELEEKVKK